jgi:hypothetical protein
VHTDVPGADLIGQQQLGEEEEADASPRRNAEGGGDSLDSPHKGAGPEACSVNCGDGDSYRGVAAPVISSPCAPTHAVEVSLAAKRQRKQVERIKSSSLRSVQRKPRTPATEDVLDASDPWEAVNQAEQQWPLMKSGSADAVRRARRRPRKHPILDDDQHNQQERMMMQVAQDDLVDQVLHNDVSGEQVQVLSSGAGCMGTSQQAHVEAFELERMQQRAGWVVAAAPQGAAMTGENDEDTEGGGDKDRGQDKRGSELDVVRKRKSKARPPVSEPPKYQKITTNDAAIGGSVTPLGILGGKGGGGELRPKVARWPRWPYKMCECGDMHHFKFKCRTIAEAQTPVHKQSAEACKGHEHTHAGIPSEKYSNSDFTQRMCKGADL